MIDVVVKFTPTQWIWSMTSWLVLIDVEHCRYMLGRVVCFILTQSLWYMVEIFFFTVITHHNRDHRWMEHK
ncbi:hypothetical protein DPQ33_05645 [Oceanidesulfovibrio indonesiensis]|uniref:Uncharacterized protein n=1 Tax=Oceanidesulfovibrio indonesiensis TaxID=54767 RepID=A0A7M3MFZ0_9BACT|nr:hypothetical protein DPQ33_05645 [Oceanidesulfovibrio indonesiensis]